MKIDELYYSNTNYYCSDKGTFHDYINAYYRYEFADKQEIPLNLLEIGLDAGGSIRLWVDFFKKGNIHGMDVINNVDVFGATIHKSCDAYNISNVSKFDDNFFDYIIDDGPHTLESQLLAIRLWLPKLKVGGKLIIEDIQLVDSVANILFEEASRHQCTSRLLDYRRKKNRGDDVIFEITKI